MFKNYSVYFILLVLIGCGPSQTIKKESPGEEKNKTNACKKNFNIGYEYQKMKMWDDARVNFEKAIACSTTYVDAYLGLSKVYIETQQYGLAEQTYRTLVEKVPKTVKGYTGLGALLVKIAKYDEAKEAYNKALAIDSTNANIYHGIGYLYEKMKDYKKAEEFYVKAYKLDPTNRAIAYALAKNYQKLGKSKEPVVLLEKIAKEFPNDIDVRFTLGDAYYNVENYPRALEQYLFVEPNLQEFGTIYIKIAKTYEELHQYSKATEYYITGIGKTENKIIPYKNLINMYLKIKNYGNAQKYITQAFAIAPNDPALNCMNGDVYIGYGNGARARAKKTGKKKDYEIAISHYETSKVWYGKALGDPTWGTYASKALKLADAKIRNTKQEMWYGD